MVIIGLFSPPWERGVDDGDEGVRDESLGEVQGEEGLLFFASTFLNCLRVEAWLASGWGKGTGRGRIDSGDLMDGSISCGPRGGWHMY